MGEWLPSIVEQIKALPPARRMLLLASAVASLSFFAWVSLGLGGEEYRLLYRGLAENEAGQVVQALAAEKVPYRIDEGGTAILVPAALVHETRLKVAGKGLPRGGSPGLELFDDPGFGVSDFVNQVNYQRALQGELARSIEQLAAVERARVQVASPKRRGFVASRSEKPSASVIVSLHPGAELETHQVRGIVHLVASSVQGLAPEQVTLVDQRGHLLAPDPSGTAGAGAPAGALSHQAKLERELGDRIEAIVARSVGAGAVVAQVRADLDWTQTESTEERYDPDSQVARSERVSTESSTDGDLVPGGVPGIGSNAPDGQGAAAVRTGRSDTRTSETINYEISKTVSRTVAPIGTIQRLDVAVLIDENSGPAVGESWSPEALGRFEDLAKHAVGYSEERGDRIAVRTAPFQTIELSDEGRDLLAPEVLLLASMVLRFLGVLVALLLFARLVVAPVADKLATLPAPSLPVRAGDLALQLAGGGREGGALPEGASEAARVPARLATEENMQALRSWLKEG